MNFSMIRYVIGLVMLFESAFLSLPCLIALIYHEKKGFSFWIMLFVCLIIGILFVMKKPKKTVYYAKEGFLTVAISWIVMSFFGALPFVINGDIPLVVDAMFETDSGFTTTGYASTDFNKWPEFSKIILVMLMFSRACAGSTGGGMKVSRLVIMLKFPMLLLINPYTWKEMKLKKNKKKAVANGLFSYLSVIYETSLSFFGVI